MLHPTYHSHKGNNCFTGNNVFFFYFVSPYRHLALPLFGTDASFSVYVYVGNSDQCYSIHA
jgi:hypothetical protein